MRNKTISAFMTTTLCPGIVTIFQSNIPKHPSHALSRLRLSGHNLNIERLRQQQHRVPYELRICTKCNWQSMSS